MKSIFISNPGCINISRLCAGIAFLASLVSSQSLFASCDCGSTDSSNPCTGSSINVSVTNERTVSFRWAFSSEGQDAACGKFANGDYWIAPRKGASSVTISAVTGAGSGPLSLDENPQLESMGLLDSTKTYGNYNGSENLIGSLPKSFSKSTSLVAAIQRDESQFGDCGTRQIVGNCADAINVVTVLSNVPSGNGSRLLRPNIDDAEKELLSLDDFDLTRMPSLDYMKGTDDAGLENIRQRWSYSTEILTLRGFDGTLYGEGGRPFRSSLLVPDYGAGVARLWYADLMFLFSSNTSADKTPALAAMLTYGKDLYHAVYNGETRTRNWASGAGQALGKYPTAVFFASLLKDDAQTSIDYQKVLGRVSTELLGYSDLRGPHELEQVNIGVNGPIWGDGEDDFPTIEIRSYWKGVLKAQCFDGATGSCNPSNGNKAVRDPYGYIDGPATKPGTNYMNVSMGPQRSFVATMLLMPKACEIVNYQPLIDYVLRVDKDGVQTANDPCAPPDPRESSSCDPYRMEGCQYYGVTWGPDPNNANQCIKNRSGQNGRFPSVDGTRISFGYSTTQVEDNWDTIVGNMTGCGNFNPPTPPLDIEAQVQPKQ